MSRTIEMLGSQTLGHLHDAIYNAFDRGDEHMYEFQVGGKKPMDRKAARYTLKDAMEGSFGDDEAGNADRTAIGSLGLKTRQSFFYWFDFGDDWWHRISVVSIGQKAPGVKYPRVTQVVGKSPPQYPGEEEDDDEDDEDDEVEVEEEDKEGSDDEGSK